MALICSKILAVYWFFLLTERGMLDGMPDLQQLSLRNNSLKSITNTAFFSLTGLTTLDLAYNRIEVIKKVS